MRHYSGHDLMDKDGGSLPWGTFLFLFAIFYFATWYDLFYTTRDPATAQEIGMLINKGLLSRRIALFVLGGFGLFNLLFRTPKKGARVDYLGLLIFGYIFWAIISVSWSDEKILTLRKVIAMVMLWAGAAWIAARYSIRDISFFVVFSGLATIVLGVVSEAYFGTFHPFDISYRFAGLFHANTQGINCAVLAIACFSLSKSEKRWKSMFNIMTIVAFIFIFLTKSRTSFASAFVVIGAYWVITSSKRHKMTFLAIAICLGCIFVLLFGDNIFAFINKTTYVGRDASDLDTLSLRMPLWQECLRFVAQQPILGSGYDSFWTPRRVMQISLREGWDVPHSHSGYIDLALGVGIIGLFAFVSILCMAGKRALFLYFRTEDCGYLYCFSMILWLCLEMSFEIVNIHPFIANFVCIIAILKMSFWNIQTLAKPKEMRAIH